MTMFLTELLVACKRTRYCSLKANDNSLADNVFDPWRR